MDADARRRRRGRPIHLLAREAERDMLELADAWAGLGEGEREETARLLSRTAPGVLRLLCPGYGRFASG